MSLPSPPENPHLEAELYFYSQEEGGRRTGVRSGFSAEHAFYGDDEHSRATQYFVGQDRVDPGESCVAHLLIEHPLLHLQRLQPFQSFKVWEGSRGVARGVITKILAGELEGDER